MDFFASAKCVCVCTPPTHIYVYVCVTVCIYVRMYVVYMYISTFVCGMYVYRQTFINANKTIMKTSIPNCTCISEPHLQHGVALSIPCNLAENASSVAAERARGSACA